MKPPTPPWMDYEEIRRCADAFLARHWQSGQVPIDVEKIVDARLGVDIITVLGLQSKIGVEGFLSRDRRAVYVDERVSIDVPARYRFTLAHELGHHELHSALYGCATFRSPAEWLGFQSALSPKEVMRYEWQANCFAGLILAPRDHLADAVQEAILHARRYGYEIDQMDAADREFITSWVARQFEVSADVISKRAAFDGLWSNG